MGAFACLRFDFSFLFLFFFSPLHFPQITTFHFSSCCLCTFTLFILIINTHTHIKVKTWNATTVRLLSLISWRRLSVRFCGRTRWRVRLWPLLSSSMRTPSWNETLRRTQLRDEDLEAQRLETFGFQPGFSYPAGRSNDSRTPCLEVAKIYCCSSENAILWVVNWTYGSLFVIWCKTKKKWKLFLSFVKRCLFFDTTRK